MRSKTLVLSLLMVLGCAKGQEIDLQDVVILPAQPPSTADASVDSGGSEPATTTNETSIPAPVGAPAAASVDTRDAAPDIEVLDAAPPSLGDSGT